MKMAPEASGGQVRGSEGYIAPRMGGQAFPGLGRGQTAGQDGALTFWGSPLLCQSVWGTSRGEEPTDQAQLG